jgi:hypothetical protein
MTRSASITIANTTRGFAPDAAARWCAGADGVDAFAWPARETKVQASSRVTKRTAGKIDTSDLAELIIEAKGTQSWKHYLMQVRNVAIQRRLVQEGMNLREVADDIGIAKSVVHRVAQQLNIDLGPEPSPGPRHRRSVTG